MIAAPTRWCVVLADSSVNRTERTFDEHSTNLENRLLTGWTALQATWLARSMK